MNLSSSVKSLLRGVPRFLSRMDPNLRAGVERLCQHRIDTSDLPHLLLHSPAFETKRRLPLRFTQDGRNSSPGLRWNPPPSRTESLVLIVEDPDAPMPRPFVHWLIANLDPMRLELPEGVPVAGAEFGVQGLNTLQRSGYLGAAPPRGDRRHHYHFQLFAMDRKLDLEPGFGREELLTKMDGHVVGFGEIVGTYRRPVRKPARRH